MSPRRLPVWLALGGAVLVGVLTATQARINGSLGVAIGDGFTAALISFGSGLLILVVLCAVLPAGRAALGRLVRGIRPGPRAGEGVGRGIPIWMLLGGLAGAVTVATQSLTVATIGVALFTVGVVAVTMGRVAGGGLVLAAVVLCVTGEGVASVPWWMLLLPFLAGAGIAWQQATNGRLRQAIGSPLVATLVNFVTGSIALALALVVHLAVDGVTQFAPASLWLFTGGAIGVVYIFLSAALVRHTGVLLLGLGSVVGLLTTSIVLDALWPPLAGPSLPVAVAAVVVALSGVVVAVVPWTRLRRGAQRTGH